MPEARDIIRAAKAGNVEQVRTLLAEDPALLNARDDDGATPLHYAAWKGHVELAKLLLERGADCSLQNANGHWGGTPLHAAAHANQRAIAELLIHHGANVTCVSGNGRTPLDETTFHRATAVAKVLRANGAQ